MCVQVVGAKHVLEEFRVGVTAVMLAAKQDIQQGNLKHKDLTGQEVSSQVRMTSYTCICTSSHKDTSDGLDSYKASDYAMVRVMSESCAVQCFNSAFGCHACVCAVHRRHRPVMGQQQTLHSQQGHLQD